MKHKAFPAGWDEERVARVLKHYESQTEEEAVAEDEAAFETDGQTMMEVPTELVPAVRQRSGQHAGRLRSQRDSDWLGLLVTSSAPLTSHWGRFRPLISASRAVLRCRTDNRWRGG